MELGAVFAATTGVEAGAVLDAVTADFAGVSEAVGVSPSSSPFGAVRSTSVGKGGGAIFLFEAKVGLPSPFEATSR